MPTTFPRFVVTFLCIGIIILSSLVPLQLAQAAPGSLIWKPYLQQLTDSSVIILWVTQTGTSAKVRYSTDTSYSSVAVGNTRTIVGTQLHRVELTGLQPNTTYNYKIYTDSQDMLPGQLLSFETAPGPGSNDSFTFVVFGDYGKNSASQMQLRDQMLLDSFDFILTTGDNAYNSGNYTEFHTNVFEIYQDLFPKVGLFPTLGNHDDNTANGAPYLDIFDLPQNAWRSSHRERYYSFDYGNVHFVALDSNAALGENDTVASDDMFDWLRNDLGQTTQPWKMVAFHHPAYSTGAHGSESAVQAKLVPVFEEYGVDLVFNGHDHIYQRTKPLRGGQETTTTAGGIVYIVSGGGSMVSYGCNSNASWVVISYCSQSYGIYSRVGVNGNSVTTEAIDNNGTIKDTYILSKSLNVPVESVSISGATSGLAGIDVQLSARASPITTTAPITYVWQATGQSSQTDVSGLVSNINFTWLQTGTRQITLTVTNEWGTTHNTYTVNIYPLTSKIYLPVILRQ